MRRYLVLAVLGASMLALGAAVSPSLPRAVAAGTRAVADGRAAASGGAWGKGEEVPGTAALNIGGAAEVRSVSCASAGDCSAGGNVASSNGTQAWVASENDGTWGHAVVVAAALNTGGSALIGSVSCASAGNCGAGGSYLKRSGHLQAFVVSEVHGTWGNAKQVAGTLNMSGNAQIYTVSCGSAGNCSAAGYYRDSSGRYQAFVITENNGTWGHARKVGAALNTGGNAASESVSCPAAGNCSAGGQYRDRSRHTQAFIINKRNGTWGHAEEVPGTAALNTGGNAQIASVSCPAAGNCGAGGSYQRGKAGAQVFVVNEVHGTWGHAVEVPGTAALNAGGNAQIASVSCASAGNCSAGGSYADVHGHLQAFVVDEVDGTWGAAEEIPGTAALNQGGNAVVASLSCGSRSHCSAGGYYFHTNSIQQTLVAGRS